MKRLFFSLFIALAGFSYANQEIGGLPGLTIVSNVPDSTIAVGFTQISGTVNGFSSLMPVRNVRVGTNSVSALTDSAGHFSILVPSTDSVFYCYRNNWKEIYQEDFELKSQHTMEVKAYMSQGQQQLLRKPVIYFYNPTALEASVKIKPKGTFTFTYPKYDNGWDILVNPPQGNASIADLKTGKEYPYLFWEAETEGLFFNYENRTMKGWVVHRDTCIDFLENQLSALGLTATEQTDFITFWGPIMTQNELNVVQFLVDDSYSDKIAGIEIYPKPDAMRRIYLLTAPVESSFIGLDVVPQKFEPFVRNGFTVLEWGGTELSFTNLKL